jgi:nucleotide-binding universal stress UspA family protein
MRVLLAVDGSKHSEAGLRALVSQIKPSGADVLVLSVVQPFSFSIPPQMAAGYEPEQEVALKEQLGHAQTFVDRAAQTLQAAGFKTSRRVVQGEIRSSILDVAAEWPADLIVVGSHGRQGLSRFLLGSVAESVARNAKCSVLIARLPANQ